jgi:NDP-sugar pyrophosphorylase family protein
MFKPEDLFDLSQTEHGELFAGGTYAWEALKKIKEYIAAHVKSELKNRCEGDAYIGDDVFIGEGTVVEDGVMIKGPAIIGRNCQIRHNAWLFNGAQVPHFNYVGDSILGHKAHLGAGVVLSNVKSVKGNIFMTVQGQPFDTGLRKFGALIGDHAEIGCNAVLNPGSVIGRNAIIYPNVCWRDVLPANMIAKNKATVEVVALRPREA